MCIKDSWWAKGPGRDMELGRVLDPLNAHREKLLFVQGLFNEEALKGNIHSSQTGNLLSGAPLEAGGGIRSGTRHGRCQTNRVCHKNGGSQTPTPRQLRWGGACQPWL